MLFKNFKAPLNIPFLRLPERRHLTDIYITSSLAFLFFFFSSTLFERNIICIDKTNKSSLLEIGKINSSGGRRRPELLSSFSLSSLLLLLSYSVLGVVPRFFSL